MSGSTLNATKEITEKIRWTAAWISWIESSLKEKEEKETETGKDTQRRQEFLLQRRRRHWRSETRIWWTTQGFPVPSSRSYHSTHWGMTVNAGTGSICPDLKKPIQIIHSHWIKIHETSKTQIERRRDMLSNDNKSRMKLLNKKCMHPKNLHPLIDLRIRKRKQICFSRRDFPWHESFHLLDWRNNKDDSFSLGMSINWCRPINHRPYCSVVLMVEPLQVKHYSFISDFQSSITDPSLLRNLAILRSCNLAICVQTMPQDPLLLFNCNHRLWKMIFEGETLSVALRVTTLSSFMKHMYRPFVGILLLKLQCQENKAVAKRFEIEFSWEWNESWRWTFYSFRCFSLFFSVVPSLLTHFSLYIQPAKEPGLSKVWAWNDKRHWRKQYLESCKPWKENLSWILENDRQLAVSLCAVNVRPGRDYKKKTVQLSSTNTHTASKCSTWSLTRISHSISTAKVDEQEAVDLGYFEARRLLFQAGISTKKRATRKKLHSKNSSEQNSKLLLQQPFN